ncbi:hypothetical protein MOQ72_09415 [Saccharopolyspora sp. K220]|uniref:hypothetical protein n=1 Tax=Saccharopolyspora soli TaxID=2926618 RepID=UPI001F57F170|nr:hypothetical protein [Saccharopolyspora soli]MCI2417644.1 hypothetical protein [Saccharopolyspora soli]
MADDLHQGCCRRSVDTRIRPRRWLFQDALTVDIATGEAHYTPPLPGKSLAIRLDAGLVHSPDGRGMAFVVSGSVWVSDVDSAGRPIGTAKRVSEETGDCLHTVDELIGEPAAKPATAPTHTFRTTPRQAGFWWHREDYLTGHTCC